MKEGVGPDVTIQDSMLNSDTSSMQGTTLPSCLGIPPKVQSPANGLGLGGTQSHTGRALAFKVPPPRSTLPTLLPLALRICLSFNYTGI